MDAYEKTFVNFDLRDEVLKLRLILKENDNFFIGRNYVLEKVDRMLSGVPITLDYSKQRKFNEIKQKMKGNDKNE